MTAPLPPPIDFHSHHVPSRWTPLSTAGLGAAQAARWDQIDARLPDRAALLAAVERATLLRGW